MSWWSKIFGSKPAETRPPASKPPERPEGPRAAWLPADKNRFGVPIIDLISVTGKMLSASSNPQSAATAMSWASKPVADLELACEPVESLPCELRYPAARDLPDGWLFQPAKMEEKWAIAYRGGAIYMLRSWTGMVGAVGRTRRDGDDLVVERVDRLEDTLRIFGDPVETFDWILRAHALGQELPLPIAKDAAGMLESVPLSVFGPFGHVATCAATSWAPPPPPRPLRTNGDAMIAVRNDDQARLRALVASGVSLDARSMVAGYTPLHLAAFKGSVPLTRLLLELGADPNVLADRAMCALIVAVVNRAPLEVLELLAGHGAVAAPNVDGFGLVHAIAETDHVEYLAWAVARGLDLEARTRNGHTPLHIAAGLGHVEALRALLAAGADRAARDSEGKTPRDVAVAEDKPAAVAALDAG